MDTGGYGVGVFEIWGLWVPPLGGSSSVPLRIISHKSSRQPSGATTKLDTRHNIIYGRGNSSLYVIVIRKYLGLRLRGADTATWT